MEWLDLKNHGSTLIVSARLRLFEISMNDTVTRGATEKFVDLRSESEGHKKSKRGATMTTKIMLGTLGNRGEICLKLTLKTPERRHSRCSGVFIVNFDYISLLFLVFLLLTLNK